MGVCCSASNNKSNTRKNNNGYNVEIQKEPSLTMIWPSTDPLPDAELEKLANLPTEEHWKAFEEKKIWAEQTNGRPYSRIEELLEWEEDHMEIEQGKLTNGEISKQDFCQQLLNQIDHYENVLYAQYKFYPNWKRDDGEYEDPELWGADGSPGLFLRDYITVFEEFSGCNYTFKYTITQERYEALMEYEEEEDDQFILS